MTDNRKSKFDLIQIKELFEYKFNDLIFHAMSVHKEHFPDNKIQASTLLSIKTGGCPEDCKYCPQSAHYNTSVEKDKVIDLDVLRKEIEQSKNAGATRFCMGAAWRELKDRDIDDVIEMIKIVKSYNMESCLTLGMLTEQQAQKFKEAGLDYYNHNIDSSKEMYEKIITTRTYEDRLNTIDNVNKVGLKVCCGGIMGLGETLEDRIQFVNQLCSMEQYPTSIPINKLVKVKGTPLYNEKDIDIFDFIKVIAIVRITMPKAYIRLSAGRENMSESEHALCFLAGANSIFLGDKLLTTNNKETNKDLVLLDKLGLELESI